MKSYQVKIPIVQCSKADTLELLKLAFQTSVMLSLCTDLEQNKNPLLKFNFKSIVERDLQNIGEKFSDAFLVNIERASEKATLEILVMFYSFNNRIKVKEHTDVFLLVAYCASIFRTINNMSYKDNSTTTLKNMCHRCVSTFNRQYPQIADLEYAGQNILEALTEGVVSMSNTIKYN